MTMFPGFGIMGKYPTLTQLRKLIVKDLTDILSNLEKTAVGADENYLWVDAKFRWKTQNGLVSEHKSKAGLMKQYKIHTNSRKIYCEVPTEFEVYAPVDAEKIPDSIGYQVLNESLGKLHLADARIRDYFNQMHFSEVQSAKFFEFTITPKVFANNCKDWKKLLELIEINEQQSLDMDPKPV